MRLDKLLANLKYGSRSEIKKIIKEKQVLVNDVVVKDSSIHVEPTKDKIVINGEVVNYKEYLYLMLNKPSGYLSASFDERQKTVIDLIDNEDKVYDLFPCGRLDIDTEGLIILSNDGQFSHKLLHPKKEIYKKYYVEVAGNLTSKDEAMFLSGLEILDGEDNLYKTKQAKLEIISTGEVSKAYVYICEGKFHQVKRMFQKVNKKVLYLKRIAMGKLYLDENLKMGEYRSLTDEEINLLFINQNIFQEENNV